MAAVLLVSSPVSAGDEDELVMQGVELYNDGQYAEALEIFIDVYKTQKRADVAYNIGRCYQNMGDCASALQFYYQLRSIARQNGNEEQIERAESRIDELSGCAVQGHVELACSPADVTVKVDAGSEEYACGDLFLKSGSRKLVFSHPSYGTAVRYYNVTPGEVQRFFISLDGKEDTLVNSPPRLTNSDSPASVQNDVSQNVDTNEKSVNKLGVGLAASGLALSVAGAGVTAAAAFQEGSSDAMKGTGVALSAVGIAAGVLGIVFIALDIDAVSAEDVAAYLPSLQFDPESASAMFKLKF